MAEKTSAPEQGQATASAPGAGETAIPSPEMGKEDAEALFAALRNNQLLSGLLEGRDVSLVYIDRHKVQHYYTSEPIAGSLRSRAEGPSALPRRLGDSVVNPVPLWELERVGFVYQRPLRYEEARKRLGEQGLLILVGPAGSGKRATALHLLSGVDFPGADSNIYELNPDLRLADVAADDLPANARLLLETPGGQALAQLKRFQLNTLANALSAQQRRSALVIAAERLPGGVPPEIAHYLLRWELTWPQDPTVARRNVLAQHLRYLLLKGDRSEERLGAVDRLVDEPAIISLLAENITPAQLADLADLLLAVLLDELSLDQALARFGQGAAEEVARWFDRGHPLDLETLLVAAAVFNRAPYQAVFEAAQALAKRLQPEEAAASAEEKPAQRTSIAAGRKPRRHQVEAIQAQLTTATLRRHYGEVQEEVVELKNPAWQEAVLRYVWELVDLRQPLLEWLMDYGAFGDHYLRTRAAAAIGALARSDFGLIESQVLRRWADSPNPNVRRSAAQILGITIWDEVNASASAGLLHYWASQNDKPRWQWTAAAAFAGLAGLRYPQRTLADLKLIAGRTHLYPALLEPLFRALLNFYAAMQSMPEWRITLLQELAAWSSYEPQKREERASARAVQRAALLGFWVMLWPQRDDPVWSLLLADAGSAGPAQDLVVQLMRRSFEFRQPQGSFADDLHPRRLGLEGLRRLVEYVVRSPQADHAVQPQEADHTEHLACLLQGLAASCRQGSVDEWDRLRYAAEGWRDLPGEATRFVDIILNS